MTDSSNLNSIKISLLVLAFIAVVAAMKLSSDILIPLLLSFFIAIISAPALFWLTSKKIPTPIALIIVISTILVAGFGLALLLSSSIDSFTKDLPLYEQSLHKKVEYIRVLLEDLGIKISTEDMPNIFNPAAAMKLVAVGLNGLGSALTNSFMILLTVIFILLEAANFPQKLQVIFKEKESSLIHFDKFINKVKQYMAIKTIVSMGTGIVVTLMLMYIGVSYPFLWGMLAFLLNYIPNIGSIIASVPPTLLALIQFGTPEAISVAVGFLFINLVAGNIIEPKFMGKGLGLSTLVVFLSLLFWGWVFGPVGMLLSVPLTITVKIAVESSENLKWIAVILGPEVEKK